MRLREVIPELVSYQDPACVIAAAGAEHHLRPDHALRVHSDGGLVVAPVGILHRRDERRDDQERARASGFTSVEFDAGG